MGTQNFQAPGIDVIEKKAGVPQIRGVPTSVGAMIGRCLRGPAGTAVKVDGFPKFERIFGSYDPNSYAPEQVKLFFDNGGTELYFTRVLASTTPGNNVKASRAFQDIAPANAVTFISAGEGSYGNGFSITTTKNDAKIGLANSTLISATGSGAITELELTPSVAARIEIGDQIRFFDGTTTFRVIVVNKTGNKIIFASATPAANMTVALTECYLETWEFLVKEGSNVIFGPIRSLRMSNKSLRNYFITRVNVDDKEIPITVTDSHVENQSLDQRPANQTLNLQSGNSDTGFVDNDYIGNSSAKTGLYSLDGIKDVRMVAIPGVTGSTPGAVSKAGVDYCEARGDCVFVADFPANTTVSSAATFKTNNLGGSSYGLIHYPWPQILSPLSGQKASTPSAGLAMGCMARTDRERGLAKVHAGEQTGRLRGTIGLERTLSDSDRATLYQVGVNPIEEIENVGQCIMGSRTMDVTGEFMQINVRRMFIYLRKSLEQGTRFVQFEPNDPATRAMVRRAIGAFLSQEWKRGNLQGEEASEAYFVICDGTNNPQYTVNAGKMFIDVGVRIPRSTEFVVINLQQDQRGLETSLGVQ